MLWVLIPFALLLAAGLPIVLLIFWSRISDLERRLRRSERALAELRGEVWELHPRQPAAAPVSAAPPPRAPTQAPVPPPPRPAMVPLAPGQPAPLRGRPEWEALVGGKLLNRIGALALVISVGFFLKYAFDREWIPDYLRVLMGAAAGVLCLAGAWRAASRSYQVFAQGLVGAGIAILYLSVYASCNVYALVSQPVAFVLMSLVTLTAFQQAYRYGARAVALLAWAGGYLTPVLLHTGTPNEAGLFTYTALLAAGILALVALKEEWFILHPLSLLATYLIYVGWFLEAYDPAMFPLTLFFLIVFWGLFAGIEVVEIVQMRPQGNRLRDILAGVNALFLAACLHGLLSDERRDMLAPALLILGGVYVLLRAGFRERLAGAPTTAHRLEVIAAVALVLATDAQFERFTTVVLWSVEAYLFGVIAARRGGTALRVVSAGLFVWTVVRFFALPGSLGARVPAEFFPLLNERTLAGAVLTVCLVRAGAEWSSRTDGKRLLARTLEGAGAVLLFTLVTVETGDLFAHLHAAGNADPDRLEYLRLLAHSVVWTILSLGLLLAGLHRRRDTFVPMGLVVLGLGVAAALLLGISYGPILLFTPLLNERAAALLLVMAGVAAAGRLLRGGEWGGGTRIASAAGPAVVLLAFVLVTGETRDPFQQAIAAERAAGVLGEGELLRYEDQKQLALSGAWLLFSIGLMGLGIMRRMRTFRIMAFGLFGVTILKVFIYDLSFLETLYRIFSFLGLGAILLTVSWLYQRYKARIFGEDGAGTGGA